MMNYKNLRDPGSRYNEYSRVDEEVQYLSDKLNFSIEEIFSAIQEVGMNREDIIEYIRDRRERS